MDLSVGYFKGQVNKISKTYTEVIKFENVKLLDSTSMTHPTFLIKIPNDNDISWVSDITYCHWFKMDRYYFVDDIIFRTDSNIVELHCSVDVLKSFSADILGSKQVIERQENKKNLYLNDSQLPVHVDKSTQFKLFGKVLNDVTSATDYSLVLTTTGTGGGNDVS